MASHAECPTSFQSDKAGGRLHPKFSPWAVCRLRQPLRLEAHRGMKPHPDKPQCACGSLPSVGRRVDAVECSAYVEFCRQQYRLDCEVRSLVLPSVASRLGSTSLRSTKVRIAPGMLRSFSKSDARERTPESMMGRRGRPRAAQIPKALQLAAPRRSAAELPGKSPQGQDQTSAALPALFALLKFPVRKVSGRLASHSVRCLR